MHALKPEILKSRKKTTLQSVIYHYISTGKPVSSKSITDNYGIALSSASIRKILKELEKEGYLLQPHIASGRIPTDKGYRWFVDRIIELQTLALRERNRILQEYKSQISEIDELLQKTSHLLSVLSNYVGFVTTPKIDKAKIANIQLVKFSDYKILVILITDTGLIRHYIIDIETKIDNKLLIEISEILNEKFSNIRLRELKKYLLETIDELHLHRTNMEKLFNKISTELFQETESERKIYLEGTANILPLMNIKDFKNLSAILKLIEQKQMLTYMLEKDLDKYEGVKITIGKEHNIPALKEMSIIKTVYRLNEVPVGVLGIIGPKRMPYSRMISLVEFISSIVNKFIMNINII